MGLNPNIDSGFILSKKDFEAFWKAVNTSVVSDNNDSADDTNEYGFSMDEPAQEATDHNICTCSILDLMTQGCKCGAVKPFLSE